MTIKDEKPVGPVHDTSVPYWLINRLLRAVAGRELSLADDAESSREFAFGQTDEGKRLSREIHRLAVDEVNIASRLSISGEYKYEVCLILAYILGQYCHPHDEAPLAEPSEIRIYDSLGVSYRVISDDAGEIYMLERWGHGQWHPHTVTPAFNSESEATAYAKKLNADDD